MKSLQEDLEVAGCRLKRYVFCPDDPDRIRAAAFHFHGQGDYSERYDETMEVFTRQGLACVATDLPGHGRSAGRRGRVPGLEVVDAIARSNRERCRELCPEERGPLGILGHSAGGLLALRELLGNPAPYSFAWISAPLVRPEANQNALLVRLAPLIARLVPGWTVATGVSSGQCVHDELELERALEQSSGGVLFHSRVSIGWGQQLIVAARGVRERLVSHPPAIPMLVIQGSDDRVCPPQHLRDVLARADIPNLHYFEVADTLHEPFADTRRGEVFAKTTEWLGEVLGAPAAAQTSPSG